MQEIPSLKFESNYPEIDGIEIVSIEKIFPTNNFLNINFKKPHKFHFYSLFFYTSGKGHQMIDFEWYPVKKDNAVLIAKNQVISFNTTEQLKGFCLFFSPEYLEKHVGNLPKELLSGLFSPQLFNPVIQTSNNTIGEYIRLLQQEFYTKQNGNKSTIISSLFVIILTKVAQITEKQLPEIKNESHLRVFSKFTALLEEKFTESRNASFYAQELAITYKHLNTICKKIINKTAKQYIDDYIILEAKRSLVNSEITSSELSYALGFNEPTNFIKYFKKHAGLTPKSFKYQLL